MDSRVGSHEITFLLLSLGPVFERTSFEVYTSNRLGNDLGTESCTNISAFWFRARNDWSFFGVSDIPLSSEFVHHFRSGDTIWETWEVLDLGSALFFSPGS
jgi:hypothetical protein